jgi:predicted nucleic acid-binding protein
MVSGSNVVVDPQALLLLSQYALNFGILGVRENLIRYLILLALNHTSEQSPLLIDKIPNRIADLLHLKTLHIPAQLVREQIGFLEKEHRIICHGNACYAVPETLERLQQDSGNAQAVHEAVVGHLLLKLSDQVELSGLQQAQVTQALYSFLGQVFSRDGERFAKMFVDLRISDVALDSVADLRGYLVEICKTRISDEALRHKVIEGISVALENPDDSWKEFLATIAQCYRIVAILNLAPDINKIQFEKLREVFAGSRIYVDTNVILQLLVRELPFHSSTVELLKECQAVGIGFFITEMTKRETVIQLKREENLLRHTPPLPTKLLPKIVDLIDEPFVRAYYHALQKKPETAWEYFFARLEEVDSLLKSLYGVEYDPADLSDDMRQSDAFETAVLNIMDLFEQMRNRPKRVEPAEHDAFHYMLLADLQRKSPNLSLFFTADQTLRFLPQRMKTLKLEHFAVYANQLFDLVLPFLQPEKAQRTAAETYGEYFASHFMTAAGRTIPIEALSRLVRPWMEYDGLSSENVVRILQHTYMEKILDKAHVTPAKLEEAKGDFDKSLLEQLREEIKRDDRAELEALYSQLLSEAAQETDRRVSEAAHETDRRVFEAAQQAEKKIADVQSKFKEYERINTEIIRCLSDYGVSTLADVSVSGSLLPDEVCRGVADLARYGLIHVIGMSGVDVESLSKAFLQPKVKLRLSTKGHVAAPAYLSSSREQ